MGPWPRRVSVLLLCLPLGVLRLGSRVCLTNCPIACSGVHPAMIHLQDFDGFKELAEFLRELGIAVTQCQRVYMIMIILRLANRCKVDVK